MITRAPRPTSNFYLLDKAISEDKRLSWAARGVLIFLLGKPDHWTVSPAALVNETAKSSRRMGRDGVYAVLKELKEVGYLHTIGNRNDGGTFAGADYLVSESPYTAFPDTVVSPDTALPDTAEPDTAKPTQVSIDLKQGFKKKQGLIPADAGNHVLPKKPGKQKTQIPADFTPDAAGIELANSMGADLAHELASFTAHHQSQETAMPNWQAGFQSWLLKGKKFAKPAKPDANAAPAVSDKWHESAAGVARKADELNLPAQGAVESHPAFKARVMAAHKGGAA